MIAAAAWAVAAAAPAGAPQCRPDLSRALAPALFRRFPARPQRLRWHNPDVRQGEAARFRSYLRRFGRGPADFAGHYQVVPIGCGAGALCPAIVDGRTGQVRFPPDLRVVTALGGAIDTGGRGVEMLNHRADSRLLVVIGAPGEDRTRAGVHYYDWRRGRLRPVGTMPLDRFCAGRGWR